MSGTTGIISTMGLILLRWILRRGASRWKSPLGVLFLGPQITMWLWKDEASLMVASFTVREACMW